MSTEFLRGGLVLRLPEGCFPMSTDSMLLADFAPKKGRLADLGSGAGTLGLLLCSRSDRCTVTGIELDPIAHAAALENIEENGLAGRMSALLGDLRQVRTLLPPGSFDGCVSNPPYFPAGSGPAGTQETARSGASCTTRELFQAAGWLTRSGGSFCLVHKPQYLADLMALAREARLEPKRLQLVRHSIRNQPSLVLIEYRKNGRPGLELKPDLILREPDGSPSAQWRRIYEGE